MVSMPSTSPPDNYEPTTVPGAEALAAVIADPVNTLLALDFDGTLAPIIDDPKLVRVHEGAVAALGRLGSRFAKIAVVTGRPVETAVRLGGFDHTPGLEHMVVLGQYGIERWDAETGEVLAPPAPDGILGIDTELPALLDDAGLSDARIEHKGRAVVVHTRGLSEGNYAFEKLREPLAALAARHDLDVEPGKQVWEIRAHGFDKGDAIRALVTETGAEQIVFAGDDLGDLPAFDAVEALRGEGIPGLLVCSASHEQDALAALADLVVDGPDAVASWLTWLADRLDG